MRRPDQRHRQLARSQPTDLKVWQNYYRALAAKTNEFPVPPQPQSPAADVLLALSKYDSAIEELRQASQLPYSRFPLELRYGRSVRRFCCRILAAMKGCSQVLQLRAIAELQNGQKRKGAGGREAHVAIGGFHPHRAVFDFASGPHRHCCKSRLQPIWEGLAEHQWSDAQLVELDAELAKLDFLADYQVGHAWRNGFVPGRDIDYLRRHPEQISIIF